MLFVGDDWAEAHHDIEIEDHSGKVLVRKRLPEGLAGVTRLHELVAEHLDPAGEPNQVLVGIETERGAWVQALLAAGYQVYAGNCTGNDPVATLPGYYGLIPAADGAVVAAPGATTGILAGYLRRVTAAVNVTGATTYAYKISPGTGMTGCTQ